jgi:hypothetical protein
MEKDCGERGGEGMNGPRNIIWDWRPDIDATQRLAEDVAEEYVIELNPEAQSGIILWGRYHENWIANPWTARPVIRRLLSELNIIAENGNENEVRE